MKYLKKSWVVGLIIGFILVTINLRFAGIPGITLFDITLPLVQSITSCGGEDCLGVFAIYGSIIFLLASLLISLLIGNVIKKFLTRDDNNKF